MRNSTPPTPKADVKIEADANALLDLHIASLKAQSSGLPPAKRQHLNKGRFVSDLIRTALGKGGNASTSKTK